jgi:hypothetical protein
MTTREEYDLVKELARRHAASTAVLNARAVVAQAFGSDRAVGMLRLLAGADDAGLARADLRSEEFREALAEMLSG